MDEETRQYFDRIENSLESMMSRINDQFERVIDQMKSLRDDVDITTGHVLNGLQGNLSVSQRVTKLEQEIWKRGAP